MPDVIDKLTKLVIKLQGTADEIDTMLLDERLLASHYTCSVSELRVRLDLVRESITQLSSQVSDMSEEE